MKLLALDTSSAACSVALLLNGAVQEQYQLAPHQHAEMILTMIDKALADAGISLQQLDAIAFGCGPGSFTGIRIAASVTQGLAFGANLPVLAVSSLQALAQTAYRLYQADSILAVVDAHMREVYWAAYQRNSSGLMTAVIADQLSRPAAVVVAKNSKWLGVGDGWQAHAQQLVSVQSHCSKIMTDCYPHAQDIALLGAAYYLEGRAVAAEQAIPIYLRDKSAWQTSPLGQDGES